MTNNEEDKKFRFFAYLLESYSLIKGKSASEVLSAWDSKGITDKIYQGYFQYHQEAIENAYADIDNLTLSGC